MKLTSFLATVFLIIIFTGIAIAQTSTPEYKSPLTIERLDVTYTVNEDGTYTQDAFGKIRINIDQAVQSSAQTYLSYSETMQNLEVLEAYTETADGEKIVVPDDKIITQQSPISTTAPAFGDIKITVIVFPQIAVGAAKTYHYKQKQIKPLFENQFSMFEMIPQSVDIKNATITIITPKNLKIYVQAIDIEGGQVKSDLPGKSKWVWTIKDQKGQKPEEGAIDEANYSPRLAVTTFANFNEVAEAYLARAADKEMVTDEIQKLANEITDGIANKRDQAAELYQWVVKNIRYVALNFGLGGVVPRDAVTIKQTGYGDCKDKVVLLNSLLTAKGIKSAPVLINASDFYWQPDVAIPSIYNHAITYLPELDIFVDPTAETAPFGVLPNQERGKFVLVTRGVKKNSGIMMIPENTPEESILKTVTTMTITNDGNANGKAVMEASGGMDYVLRSFKATIPPGREDQAARVLISRSGFQGEGNITGGDPRDLKGELKIETEFTMKDTMLIPGPGALTIPPGVPNPSPIRILAFMPDLPERKHPMYSSGYTKIEITSVTLPDGIKITLMPKNTNYSNKYGSYSATYTLDGQTLKRERKLTVMTPRGLCTPDIYPDIRELGQTIMQDLRKQILYGE